MPGTRSQTTNGRTCTTSLDYRYNSSCLLSPFNYTNPRYLCCSKMRCRCVLGVLLVRGHRTCNSYYYRSCTMHYSVAHVRTTITCRIINSTGSYRPAAPLIFAQQSRATIVPGIAQQVCDICNMQTQTTTADMRSLYQQDQRLLTGR